MKGLYLITVDAWFLGPDGKQYRAVWGEVEIVDDKIMGIKTNRGSTNWYAKVGGKENHVIIAGCQIHYAIKCDKKPHDGDVEDYSTGDDGGKKGIIKFKRPSQIYIAD